MRRMITRSRFFTLALLATICTGLAQAQAPKVYELRTYTANPGKLSELVRFFKEATEPAFARHGMKSIGYWIPTDAPAHDDTFIYILEHASREEATKNWAAFRTDAEWVKARAGFEANGPLSGKIAAVFMEQLAIPGAAKSRATAGSFELRTYTSTPGKLDNVIARFKDGTNGIFNRLDMPVIAYWRPTDGPEHDNTLIYIIAHPSKAAGVANWATFVKDPAWVKLRTESEAAGPIVAKAVGVYMDPVEYSRWK
jgi:NIPSNAP